MQSISYGHKIKKDKTNLQISVLPQEFQDLARESGKKIEFEWQDHREEEMEALTKKTDLQEQLKNSNNGQPKYEPFAGEGYSLNRYLKINVNFNFKVT